MSPAFLDPGLLNRRARLEVNEPVVDEFGGAADHWREVAEVSIRLEPIAVEVGERFGQREGRASHRVTLRHRPGVDRGMAFGLGGRRLLIRSLQDPDDSGRFLVCRCEAEA